MNQTVLARILRTRGFSRLKTACRPWAEPSEGLNQDTRFRDWKKQGKYSVSWDFVIVYKFHYPHPLQHWQLCDGNTNSWFLSSLNWENNGPSVARHVSCLHTAVALHDCGNRMGARSTVLVPFFSALHPCIYCAGTFKQSMGASNRVGIRLSYWPPG